MELQHIMIYGFMLLITYLFSNDYIAHICIYKSMFMNIYIYICVYILVEETVAKKLLMYSFFVDKKNGFHEPVRFNWNIFRLRRCFRSWWMPSTVDCWISVSPCFTTPRLVFFLLVLILYLFCFLQAFECTCCFMLTKGSSRLTVAVFNPF